MENKEKNKEDIELLRKRIAVKRNLRTLFKSVSEYIVNIMSIRDGTDVNGTIEGIKKDMVFKGHSVWILITSIFIASIGLNVNSTPVVIGAMLISPLMGPILAIGLSVGTNDWETLVKSLKNFGVAIVISLITSTIYFLISPLSEASGELIARTKPTFLDVLIAIFGGVAGIVAGSKSEKTNVIPGVAIATALMPPLCTAGYGLATWQLSYFFGAFYLFFLNTVFISLSTLIIVRYLRFPIKHFIDPKRESRIKKYMLVFIIIIILPSTKIFWNVIKESRFNTMVNLYLNENIDFKKSKVINSKITYSDTLSIIELYIIGDEVEQSKVDALNEKLKDYGLIKSGGFWKSGITYTDKTRLTVHQATETFNPEDINSRIDYLSSNLSKDVRVGVLEDIYKKNEELMLNKDKRIKFLEDKLLKHKKDTIPYTNLRKEVKIYFEKINKFAYAKTIETNDSGRIDTISTFLVAWNGYAWKKQRKEQKEILEKWLKVRLRLDTIRVVEF